MPNWAEMAVDAVSAAKAIQGKHPRSCVSRAYYAAYSALTGTLSKVKGVTFRYGGNNPAHEKLPSLIEHHLKLVQTDKREVKAAIRRLRHARIEADYFPPATVDERVARQSLIDACLIFNRLEMEEN